MYIDVFFEKKSSKITIKDLLSVDKDIDIKHLKKNTFFNNISTLESAKEGDLTFFSGSSISGEKYKKQLINTKATYVLIDKKYKDINKNIIAIITDNPYMVFYKLYSKIYEEKNKYNTKTKIDKTAKISNISKIGSGCKIHKNVIIGDFVSIGNNVKIEDNTIIKSGVKIGNNCKIGKNCKIGENTTINFTKIGDNCEIHSNSSIGQDGFGYIFNKDTKQNEKVKHFSFVKIGNNVNIHSNCCIDRGVFEPTIIEDGVKIDNLCQIGHNVKIGKNTIICGCSAIGGSTEIGSNCLFGGKNAIIGHIKIDDNSISYANSFITKSYPKNTKIMGYPADFENNWKKQNAKLKYFLKKLKNK